MPGWIRGTGPLAGQRTGTRHRPSPGLTCAAVKPIRTCRCGCPPPVGLEWRSAICCTAPLMSGAAGPNLRRRVVGPLDDRGHRISPGQPPPPRTPAPPRHDAGVPHRRRGYGTACRNPQQTPVTAQVTAAIISGVGTTSGHGGYSILARQRGSRAERDLWSDTRSDRSLVLTSPMTRQRSLIVTRDEAGTVCNVSASTTPGRSAEGRSLHCLIRGCTPWALQRALHANDQEPMDRMTEAPLTDADLDFIAAARNYLPRLVEEISELRSPHDD
jgi:hypothetical protein